MRAGEPLTDSRSVRWAVLELVADTVHRTRDRGKLGVSVFTVNKHVSRIPAQDGCVVAHGGEHPNAARGSSFS